MRAAWGFPFPPGSSPFRINGIFYMGARRFIDLRIPNGLDGLSARIGDARLLEFYRQPFLATQFYDLLPLMPLSEASAEAVNQTLSQFVVERTTAQAAFDFKGVYKSALASRSGVTSLLEGIRRISARVYEFGSIEFASMGMGRADLVRREMPKPALAWYVATLEAYIGELLRLAGATSPVIRCTNKEKVSSRAGIDVYDVSFRITWEDEGG